MSLLVIVAHPALHRSRINAHLLEVAQGVADEVVDLYDSYPDFDIDVSAEQQRLRSATSIVLQHPLYWYATPALLKEWVDLVFEHGFAYGHDAQALEGKIFTQSVSTGADAESYGADGFNRFSIEQLLQPMQATAHFCGMRWVTPFATSGGHVITDEEITASGVRYREWLQQLQVEGGAQ